MAPKYSFSTVCIDGNGIPVGDSQCNQATPIQFVDETSQLKSAINNCSLTGKSTLGVPNFDNSAGGCPTSLGYSSANGEPLWQLDGTIAEASPCGN